MAVHHKAPTPRQRAQGALKELFGPKGTPSKADRKHKQRQDRKKKPRHSRDF